MQVDPGALRVVEAVARHGTLTRAGAAMGMSQPAISYQLRRIEERLGTALLNAGRGLPSHRGGRGSAARTAAGAGADRRGAGGGRGAVAGHGAAHPDGFRLCGAVAHAAACRVPQCPPRNRRADHCRAGNGYGAAG
ncbi:LysR family transcriptional regulator [Gemmobacter lanyuensis]